MTAIQVETIVRPATIRDIGAIIALINGYAAQGLMLSRTEFEMAENIRDFVVAYEGDVLLGCGALHFYTPLTAEVRSLAVSPEAKGRGVGRLIMHALEDDARLNNLESIFTFTYVAEFFGKFSFIETERGELPLKVWKDCLRCPKFQNCDEIAMIKRLRGRSSAVIRNLPPVLTV